MEFNFELGTHRTHFNWNWILLFRPIELNADTGRRACVISDYNGNRLAAAVSIQRNAGFSTISSNDEWRTIDEIKSNKLKQSRVLQSGFCGQRHTSLQCVCVYIELVCHQLFYVDVEYAMCTASIHPSFRVQTSEIWNCERRFCIGDVSIMLSRTITFVRFAIWFLLSVPLKCLTLGVAGHDHLGIAVVTIAVVRFDDSLSHFNCIGKYFRFFRLGHLA